MKIFKKRHYNLPVRFFLLWALLPLWYILLDNPAYFYYVNSSEANAEKEASIIELKNQV